MSTVQSIERAFQLLDVISNHPEGIQVTRLSEQVGLSKSTVHRLLMTLVNLNYIYQDPESEKYKMGYRIISLARHAMNSIEIIPIAKPHLQRLSADVNETIHLCIEDQGEVMYVDKIESNQTIRMYSRVGSRAPMYCTGVGKILLSGMSEEDYEKTVASIEFIKKTEATIGSREELDREIKRVKSQQYALDNIENEAYIRCIAAPIYDNNGKIIASFSISGPTSRITMERVNEELIYKVTETSKAISKQLGYLPVFD